MIGSERHVVHDMPGTTMDAVDSLLEIDGRKYIFVDTVEFEDVQRSMTDWSPLLFTVRLKQLKSVILYC